MKKRSLWMIAAALLLAACSDSDRSDDAPGGTGGSGGTGGTGGATPQAFSRDCLWYLHSDPDLVNIAYPDTAANYWAGLLLIPPGGEVRISGEFPFARYMSFNIYDQTLASYDAIADSEILPDAGSHNPFLPMAKRDDSKRAYTVRVISDTAPEDPGQREPNTLYTGLKGAPYFHGRVIYRIYVPDRGTSLAGDVDLPRVTIVLPGGQELSSPESCEFLERTRLGLGINETLAETGGLGALSARRGTDPLQWVKFVGMGPTAISFLQYAPIIADLPAEDAWRALTEAVISGGIGTSGGFLSNRDNAYVTTTADHKYGEIAVISARAPVTPRTYENVPTMPPAELRYWSLCTNDVYTQRYYDCVYDEQVPLDRNRNYVVVVSTTEMRPANARPECGVAWLNWGPRGDSLLILRNMLPNPGFSHAIQNIANSGEEQVVMGDYYPYGLHASKAEFEALSADPAGDAAGCRVEASGLRDRARAR